MKQRQPTHIDLNALAARTRAWRDRINKQDNRPA